tara:strand:- start:203 stop:406 length:204 start_codon:yes stop_codon:yes gene_type:complete
MKTHFFIVFSLLVLTFNYSFADENEASKNNIVSRITESISSAIEGLIRGEGDSEVQITALCGQKSLL